MNNNRIPHIHRGVYFTIYQFWRFLGRRRNLGRFPGFLGVFKDFGRFFKVFSRRFNEFFLGRISIIFRWDLEGGRIIWNYGKIYTPAIGLLR